MAGKKKDMDGGLLFEYFTKTPTDTIQVLNKSNAYLNTIRELEKSYSKIDSNKISVNNLNTKVKSLSIFSQKIKNKEELMPLLDAVKKILIKKIELSLTSKFVFDYTIPPSKLLDNLLHQLKEFEKLLNQLKLLDNQFNLSYSTSKESFIENILGKYEDYIEQIFRENPNIDILGQLSQQVQEYIRLYSEFIKSMTNNRKMTNPISKILQRLNILSDRISIKIQLLSGQGTNINGNHISNEMKRRINLLYDANRNKKSINYNSILTNLHVEYQQNPREYNLKELSILADIGSKIKSISRMRNGNNKNILLRDLRKTILQSEGSLNKYLKFQEYKKLSILAEIGSKIESISRMRNGNNKYILLRDLRKTILQSEGSLNKYPKFQEYKDLISNFYRTT